MQAVAITPTATYTHNHFMALSDFVCDYPVKLARKVKSGR